MYKNIHSSCWADKNHDLDLDLDLPLSQGHLGFWIATLPVVNMWEFTKNVWIPTMDAGFEYGLHLLNLLLLVGGFNPSEKRSKPPTRLFFVIIIIIQFFAQTQMDQNGSNYIKLIIQAWRCEALTTTIHLIFLTGEKWIEICETPRSPNQPSTLHPATSASPAPRCSQCFRDGAAICSIWIFDASPSSGFLLDLMLPSGNLT